MERRSPLYNSLVIEWALWLTSGHIQRVIAVGWGSADRTAVINFAGCLGLNYNARGTMVTWWFPKSTKDTRRAVYGFAG